jgi:predicted MFS family arabinose efflux permease
VQQVLASSQAEHGVNTWRATLSGLCASLVGIGLSRFAYTPLIPALIAADWFTPSQSAYLGAANLAGYLAGALLGRPMAARAPVGIVLRMLMALATVAFFACAFPLSFLWFFVWRFAAGLSGGALMVLAAPSVLPHVAPSRRGLAGGIIFTGVGLGIVASGTLVPLLLGFGLFETWIGLGLVSLVLTIVSWGGWPHERALRSATPKAVRAAPSRPLLRALYVEYALNAMGVVPHMVFQVDFIARGLGKGLDVGAQYWIVFGLGATAGPLLAGFVADRVGFRMALRLAFVVQAASVGVLVADTGPAALFVSSLVIGAMVPGVVPLVLGRVHEIVADPQARGHGWSLCTTAFAVGQAAAAYGFAFIFERTDGAYPILFALGAFVLVLALLIDLAAAASDRAAPPKQR